MDQFENLVFYADRLDDRTGNSESLFIVEKQDEGRVLILADTGQIFSDPVRETVTIHLTDGAITDSAITTTATRSSTFTITTSFPAWGVRIAKDRSNIKPGEFQLHTSELWEKVTQGENRPKATVYEMRNFIAASSHRWPRFCSHFCPSIRDPASRSGRSGGIVTGLMIYLCYYFLFSLGGTMVDRWQCFAMAVVLGSAPGHDLRRALAAAQKFS